MEFERSPTGQYATVWLWLREYSGDTSAEAFSSLNEAVKDILRCNGVRWLMVFLASYH